MSSRDFDRDLDEEMRLHIDLRAERLRERGAGDDEARHAARRRFGSPLRWREDSKHVWGWTMTRLLDAAFDECRRAVRSLRRTPGFTISVVLLLTVTIGTVTTVGSAAYELLRASLPYGEADRLVMVWSDLPKSGYARAPLSGPELFDLRERSRSLDAIAAMFPGTSTLTTAQDPVEIATVTVTGNLFSVLRASPQLGRAFTAEDEGQGKPPTIILSWALWQDRFGGDPSIVGRTIDVGGRPTAVIGIMPPHFRMTFPPDANIPTKAEAWVPFLWDLQSSPRQRYFIRIVARLRDAATLAEAETEVRGIGASLRQAFAGYAASGRTLFVADLTSDLAQPVRVPASALAFAGVFLVALAYVNLAGLWVARTIARSTEHGIHQALGASMTRVRIQLVIQAAMLSLAGCGLGLAAGLPGLAALRYVRPLSLTRIDYATLTTPVILLVLGIVTLSTIFLALVVRPSVAPMLASGLVRARVDAAPRHRIRSTLVIVQVALALVFLVCSALWTRTFINVLRIDPGFRPEQALTFRYSVNALNLDWGPQTTLFNRRLNDAMADIPGVTAAGTISHLPFDHLPNWSMGYRAEGADQGALREADSRPVSPGFLHAIGARLIAGRFFSETDDETAPPVVVVDRLLAERTWPGADPIGKRVHITTRAGAKPAPMTVIGVIEHLRYRAVEMQVREQVYLPLRQFVAGPFAFVVRSPGDLRALAASVRVRARQVDSRLPIWDIRPLQEYYDEATAERRFTATLLVIFAAAALSLVAIGIYGLLAFIVTSRRTELGIRLALGAERGQVAQSIFREGLRWAIAGEIVGGLLLIPGMTWLSSVLYGVTAYDPLSWGAAAALLLAVMAVASSVPAVRASRTDPSLLMRSQ